MKGEQYIWRTVKDGNVRPAHAAQEGQIFSWTNPPEGGHPGEDYNCRCWAEPVSDKKTPIPPRKPNCRKAKEAYQEAQLRYNELESKKEKLLEEIRELREELKEGGERMTRILGANIAAFIITLPIDRLGFLSELLSRYFGNIISTDLLETSDRLAKERGVLIRKAKYKMDQVNIIIAQLKQATQKLDEAKQTLGECEARIPGS